MPPFPGCLSPPVLLTTMSRRCTSCTPEDTVKTPLRQSLPASSAQGPLDDALAESPHAARPQAASVPSSSAARAPLRGRQDVDAPAWKPQHSLSGSHSCDTAHSTHLSFPDCPFTDTYLYLLIRNTHLPPSCVNTPRSGASSSVTKSLR